MSQHAGFGLGLGNASLSNTDFSDIASADAATRKKTNIPSVPLESIGTWEKHTKGIGMKLLTKFGFKGRLGAHEDGVSRPIEVVVRPTTQGLGFGDFTEASALKENKKFEAEWRGKEYVEVEEPKSSASSKGDSKKRKQSELEEIAGSHSWKKGKGGKKPFGMTAKAMIEKFEREDAEREEKGKSQKIIDMRGKDAKVIDASEGIGDNSDLLPISEGKPKLGQELLYNVSLVTELLEKEVSSDFKRASKLKERRLEAEEEISELQVIIDTESSKLERVGKVSRILENVDIKLSQAAAYASEKSEPAKDGVTLSSICKLFVVLVTQFRLEVSLYGLLNLLPTLTVGLITKELEEWNPLETPEKVVEVFSFVDPLLRVLRDNRDSDLENVVWSSLQHLASSTLLPCIRRVVTNEWDVEDPKSCLLLVSSIRPYVPKEAFDQTLEMIILPKLSAKATQWMVSDAVPIHVWLRPWVELLGPRLASLYPDIRRKFGQTMSNSSWSPRNPKMLSLLLPWADIFDRSSMDSLIVRNAVPRLVGHIRNLNINPSNQDLGIFRDVMAWQDLVPEKHFVAIWMGEFFPKWIFTLATWLASPNVNLEEVSVWYEGWRSLFPDSLLDCGENDQLLTCFDKALNVITVALGDHHHDRHLTSASLLASANISIDLTVDSYFKLVENWKFEERTQARLAELSRAATTFGRSARNATGGMASIPFKVVVENFASKHGVAFAPKFGVGSKLHDGKDLWQFGNIVCYLDQDVVFVDPLSAEPSRIAGSSKSNTAWTPVSLEELLRLSSM